MKTYNYPADPQPIGAMASWPASQHQFEPEHILALRAAEATGRPLLVRGEAGTGKSQLAHAAAYLTDRAFLPVVVNSTTEAQELHWKFDAIARLADAHMAANRVESNRVEANQNDPKLAAPATHATHAERRDPCPELHVSRYVQPGPLWWALNWDSAKEQQVKCRHGGAHQPATPKDWTPQENGLVLLIDEIDKAEPDLPNGLLEALANGAFDVPLLGITVRRDENCPPPLIIITTNEERELPAAFLRRCLVMNMCLPTKNAALRKWLVERGKLHFPDLPPKSLNEAANLLAQDRQAAREQGCYLPGLAEYLDLLRAVNQMGEEGVKLLPKLKHFYFDKQAAAVGLLED